MAEPDPKRAKMDNLGEKSNNGSTSNSHKEREEKYKETSIISPGLQNFDSIRKQLGFIDHTNFIYHFLKVDQPKLAILAPRRFGKSSHLNMVKKFLEIDVDKKTGKFSLNDLAETRKNYQLFNETHIMQHKKIVEDYLGKHPVIHVDFKATFVRSVEKAQYYYRKAVHKAYLEHPYLESSEKLVPDSKERNAAAQQICKKWCHDEQYKMQDLGGCLVHLTSFLYNHFDGAKVYILVDEFDAINTNALFQVCQSEMADKLRTLEDIHAIFVDMLAPLSKGEDAQVAGVLITGVSYVSGIPHSPCLNNFIIMKFLEGTIKSTTDKNVSFYGATRDEIVSLIQKLVKNKQLVNFEEKEEFYKSGTKDKELDADKIIADVQSRYNGYFDEKGERIFCIWSVLQYLQNGDAKNYWNVTDGISGLSQILKCEKVADEILKLMRGDIIEFQRVDKIHSRDLVKLSDLIVKENANEANLQVVFSFLMDQGYVSYPEGGIQGKKFKLPNVEIQAALGEMVGDIVNSFWELPTISCTKLIEDISFSLLKEEKELQKKMLEIYKMMSQVLKSLKEKDPTLLNEVTMLCVMYKTLADVESFKLVVDSQIKDAEGKCISLDRPDFLMLHKYDETLSIVVELKISKDEKNKYTTSLYALLEAMGIERTKNKKLKSYTASLKTLGRETLVIGLSMTSDFKVSLSYSSTIGEKKIFSITKDEHEFNPELYDTHNPIMLSCVQGTK